MLRLVFGIVVEYLPSTGFELRFGLARVAAGLSLAERKVTDKSGSQAAGYSVKAATS